MAWPEPKLEIDDYVSLCFESVKLMHPAVGRISEITTLSARLDYGPNRESGPHGLGILQRDPLSDIRRQHGMAEP